MKVNAALFLLLVWLSNAVTAHERPSWLDVPFVPQSRNGCGAAAIAMVMQYWTRANAHLDSAATDDRHIYAQLFRPGDKGIAGNKLKEYLEAHGFAAHVFRGEPKDLFDNLQNGRPVVVCIAPRGQRDPLHYVVVVGASASTVLFHDPARGKLMAQPLPSFVRHWEHTGNWTLLATPVAPQ